MTKPLLLYLVTREHLITQNTIADNLGMPAVLAVQAQACFEKQSVLFISLQIEPPGCFALWECALHCSRKDALA